MINRQLIDELMFEATHGACHDTESFGTPALYGDEIHKFAELIIKEVYRVADDNFYGDPHYVGEYMKDIERVFGVKND